MRGNLSARVDALEARSPSASNLLLVVGPYSGTDDPAPHVAEARRRWFERHGDWPSSDVREFHIQLFGKVPEASHAR